MIEDALGKGKAYLLAKQLHWAHVSSHQITVEPGPDTPIQVAATTTFSPLEAEVDHMAVMLEMLVAVLAHSNPTELTQGPLRPRVETPGQLLCVGNVATADVFVLTAPSLGRS